MIRRSHTKDLTGAEFGYWKVKDFAGYFSRNASWNCECRCGTKKPVRAQYLMDGRSRACRSCATGPRGTRDDKSRCFIPSDGETVYIAAAKWNGIKQSAIRRGIVFDIIPSYCRDLLSHQDYKCALSGVPISLDGTVTASLDRKNSKAGYTNDNIQWVHKDVNIMKNRFDEDYFIKFCRLIAACDGQVPPSGGAS